MSAKELVIVVNRANRVVGARPRCEMRAKRLPHRATYVLVFNSAGELYVQKRTLTKDIYPGFCDPATGGVVLAGENYEQAARRELAEELGIRDISLERHQDFYFEDPLCCVWGRIFSGIYDRPMIFQTEEVQSGEFLPVDEVLERSKTEPFAPDSLEAVKLYLQARG
jgi:isopentenyldiphosphate isomerase